MLPFIMAQMDSLGINFEGYIELSVVIIDVVDLDANLRILLSYLQWMNEEITRQMPNKWFIYCFGVVDQNCLVL